SGEIFVSSTQIRVPTDFHRMLMSGEEDDFGRRKGFEVWGQSYFQASQSQNQYRDIVRNAGDRGRTVFLDQVIFYDAVKREPVWLFFYRAFRETPAGRKPSPRFQEQKQTLPEWVPGLQPDPIGARK